MTASRTCAREGCGRSLDRMRADAIYCSPSCRLAATRILRTAEASPHRNVAGRFWHGYRAVQRPQKSDTARNTNGGAA